MTRCATTRPAAPGKGARIIVAITGTVLPIPAILFTLLLRLSCGFFAVRVPTGADAMGLIVPIAMLGGTWRLTLLAAGCAAGTR